MDTSSIAKSKKSWSTYLSLLPIFLFLILIVILGILRFNVIWNPPFVFTALNLIFLTSIMFFISILAGRSFLERKSLTLMLLGAGTLALGCGGLLAGFLIIGNDVNMNVTLYDTSVLIASIFILASSILSLKEEALQYIRSIWALLISYLSVIILISILVFLDLNQLLPVFFVQGSGVTSTDAIILYTTIVLFLISSILLMKNKITDDDRYRLWYGLGLILIALGLFGVSIQISIGDPVNWVARISQYLGAVYILIGVISSIRQRGIWMLPWENALYESEIKYRSIVETANEGIMIGDTSGIITFVNAKMEEMLGYSAKELLGTDGLFLIDKNDLGIANKQIEDRKIGIKEEYERKFIQKNGEEIWTIVSATPLKDKYGEHIGNLSMITNITERKKAENNMEIALEELKRSNQELERFAYITSHDLREPLRMITSFLQLLQKRYEDQLDQDANEFIGYAVDGAKRLDVMTNDLLQYSKITNKKREFRPINFEDVLDHALTNLKVQIEENNAVITHDPLPTINGDEYLKIQLFQNIIGNAIKYRSQETPKIHISVIKEPTQYLFSIKDNGIGMSPKHLDQIFTIFKRLHNREEYEGTGIGLAIAQKIIHQQGGEIWAESKLGKGSTFYFTITNFSGEKLV